MAKHAEESLMTAYTPNPDGLLYQVDFSRCQQHLVDIALWIPMRDQAQFKLIFPVWTPGSYVMREYTRNIECIGATAHDAIQGQELDSVVLTREGKNRWQAAVPPGVSHIRVTYQIYCREMTVRTNWVDGSFGLLNGAATFPFVAQRQAEAIQLSLRLPDDWPDVATSLKKLGRDENEWTYLASDFDELVDSPVVAGNFQTRQFGVGGKTHFLVNVGGDDLWDLARAVDDMQKIVAEHQRFWGDVPYTAYWFINLATEARGGLEHDNSTVLMCGSWAMKHRESYVDWLGLVSHEFFHTWNVRRLRPKELMRYDYEREQCFEELCIAEGITSYYDDLALVRTGLCTCEEYLARLTKIVEVVNNSPGRLVQDLKNASWDAWTKHYRPDENSPNARISYYLKGAMLAWLLDVAIAQATAGGKSLDDVMRLLWQRHRATGYTLGDFGDLVEEIGTGQLRQWFEKQVSEATELDLQPAFDWLGLRLADEASQPSGQQSVWTGLEPSPEPGNLLVRKVLRGSPADRAGLDVGDEIVALDGYRVTAESWVHRLAAYEPDRELTLCVSRRGKIVELTIRLGSKPARDWQLEIDPSASADATQRLHQWLKSPDGTSSRSK